MTTTCFLHIKLINAIKNDVKIGCIYKHYKTDMLYKVISVSIDVSTLDTLVTYSSLNNGLIWTDKLVNFRKEIYDQSIPCFTKRYILLNRKNKKGYE